MFSQFTNVVKYFTSDDITTLQHFCNIDAGSCYMIWQTCWWRGRKERCNLVKYSEPAITLSTAEDDTYSSHHGPGHFRGGCQTGRNILNLNIIREISLSRGFLIAFFSCVSDFFVFNHRKTWCLQSIFRRSKGVSTNLKILLFINFWNFIIFPLIWSALRR